eukprot:jgi/Tetstr1/424216/TSEL_000148.t2
MPKPSSKAAAKPMSASGLPPLDEDAEWDASDDKVGLMENIESNLAAAYESGPTPAPVPPPALSSWAEAGVSPALLPGPDGHVHLPPPPGHAPGAAGNFHGAGADPSLCPFSALIEEAAAENPPVDTAGPHAQPFVAGSKRSSVINSSTGLPSPGSFNKNGSFSKAGSFSKKGSFSKQGSFSANNGPQLTKQSSGLSYAPSAASSRQSGSIMSGMAAASLGLGELDRDEWTMKEMETRNRMLPILKITTDQLDGTIKPKFSQYSKHNSAAANMEAFGNAFYEELFAQAPEIRDELFADKPTELLAVKLGMILHEVVRLLALDSPRELSATIAEMALKHIEYGLEARHVEPFKAAMMATMKREVSNKGHKWSSKAKAAWVWALNEVITLLVGATTSGRPKVILLNASWNQMVERLHEEAVEQGRLKKSSKEKKKQKKTLSEEAGDSEKESDEDSDDEEEEGEEGEEEEEEGKADETGGLLRGKSKYFSKFGKSAFNLLTGGRKKRAPRAKPSKEDGHTHHNPNELFQTWRLRDQLTDGNPDYIDGRQRVGKTFLDIFAARNAWAVRDFNFGKSESHAEKMGLALELIVNSATKPKVLQHKLRVLALGHDQMGIKPAMFPRFGEALFDFLEQVLGAYGLYDDQTREAWEWMWQIVSAAFTRHLEAASTVCALVTKSWDHITTHLDLADISVQLFAALFRAAPELQKLFTKPTKMQTVMLGKALDLIVRSLSDAHVLDVELKAIAMRHIKYDIHQGHLNTFGHVLLQTLGGMVGVEAWDEDIEGAWSDIYFHIAEIFGHVISSGRGLVSKALATNDVNQLTAALALAPRRQRALAALEIEVDDTLVLPLTWTVEEGQFAMTDALLRDVLAIRGDRSTYYYGRALLWTKHPRVVALLTLRAPKLLPALLDGHMWTSRYVVNGHRRVNFYFRELYGDPKRPENRVPYASPLGSLVKHLPESELAVFAHPVVVYLVDVKWGQFARRDFIVTQLLNAGSLATGIAYLQTGTQSAAASFALAVLQLGLCAARCGSYVKPIARQVASHSGTPLRLWPAKRTVLLPYACHNMFFWINLATFVMSLALFALAFYEDVFSWKALLFHGDNHVVSDEEFSAAHAGHSQELRTFGNLAAFACGLLWVQMAESFKLTTKLSALLFALTSVLPDVGRFVVVLAVWLLGFSLALYWLSVSANLADHQSLERSMHIDLDIDGLHDASAVDMMYYVLMSSLALTGLDAIMAGNWAVRAVYAVVVLSTVVVLLNLLMSTMVSTYELMQKHFHELAVKGRAELVLAAEENSSLKRRSELFAALHFEDKLDFEEEDDGPSGGVQMRLPAETLTHPAFRVLDRIERYVGASSGKAVWDPADKISSAINLEDSRGLNAATLKMLKSLSSDVVAMAGEVYNIKRALKLDDAGTTNGSQQSAVDSQAGDNDDDADDKEGAGGKGVVNPAAPAAPANARTAPISPRFAEAAKKVTSSGMGKAKPAPAPAPAAEPKPPQPAADPNRAVGIREMATHKSEDSLWLSVDGVVHDVTALLKYHPGGKGVLLRAGIDATESFNSAHQGSSMAKARAGMAKMPVMGRLKGK